MAGGTDPLLPIMHEGIPRLLPIQDWEETAGKSPAPRPGPPLIGVALPSPTPRLGPPLIGVALPSPAPHHGPPLIGVALPSLSHSCPEFPASRVAMRCPMHARLKGPMPGPLP